MSSIKNWALLDFCMKKYGKNLLYIFYKENWEHLQLQKTFECFQRTIFYSQVKRSVSGHVLSIQILIVMEVCKK